MIRLYRYGSMVHWRKKAFSDFCREVSGSSEPAAANMHDLPTLVKDRFSGDKGQMWVVFDGTRVVGCSGAYISDFSDGVGLLGCRAWLTPEYRSQQIIRDLVLPAQRDWALIRGLKQVALTFNEYNRNLVELFKRGIVKRVPRGPRHMFFYNMVALRYQVMIQHTPQWVIFEALDPAWSFDWESLACNPSDLVE